MRRVLPALLLVLTLALASGCTSQLLTHSPTAAAAKAEDFLTALIVHRDVAAAYPMLSESARARTSQSALASAVERMPNHGQVTKVVATAYEPMPGQASMIVYLEGTGGSEPVHYVVQMSGTADTGYSEEHLAASLGEFKPSGLVHSLP